MHLVQNLSVEMLSIYVSDEMVAGTAAWSAASRCIPACLRLTGIYIQRSAYCALLLLAYRMRLDAGTKPGRANICLSCALIGFLTVIPDG